MNLFEMMEWSNWKKLTDEAMLQVIGKVLMYFVSPLKLVTDIRLVDFELAGVKCRTAELAIDGDLFVFVPGNQEAILGWDLGVEGINATAWAPPFPEEKSLLTQQLLTEFGLETEEQWDQFVNLYTTPLRKVAIAPMLVEKYALPAGTKYLGDLDTVTGEFNGDVGGFAEAETAVRELFTPPTSFEETLNFSLPEKAEIGEKYYLELSADLESYHVFERRFKTQEEIIKGIRKEGFRLLTEDQWEYAVGGGTRRLFRWGNDLDNDDSYWGRQVRAFLQGANMFGLFIDDSLKRYEITLDAQLKLDHWETTGIPLLDFLPLATYFRAPRQLEKTESLPLDEFLFRRAVVIDRK